MSHPGRADTQPEVRRRVQRVTAQAQTHPAPLQHLANQRQGSDSQSVELREPIKQTDWLSRVPAAANQLQRLGQIISNSDQNSDSQSAAATRTQTANQLQRPGLRQPISGGFRDSTNQQPELR